MAERVLKLLLPERPPRELAVAIVQTEDGRIYLTHAERKANDWQLGTLSIAGYYDSVETAEREAFATIKWLTDPKP
jgi:hypothetical protein